jgi:uncharacterized protein YjbI with pentapeptide repeats
MSDLEEASLDNADLSGAWINRANLRRATLCSADLSMAILYGSDLREANLSEACLDHANCIDADLGECTLSGANLFEANFSNTNLFEADLSMADLSMTTFNDAKLDGADFTGATIGSTAFNNVNLSGVKGLDTLDHRGPSYIGIDTIYKSKGNIPHAFLRGAGVPENFIKNMSSMAFTEAEVDYCSLFISYSIHDQEFAERLYADLRDKGIRCWKDNHNLHGGKKTHQQIDEAIRVYDRLLLILSPASMESEWVRTEIAIARKREVEQKKEVLFPISLCPFETIRKWEYFDSDIGKDSAREIREFHIPDFSNWKDHDSYKLAFDKLLDDLHGKPDSSAA